VGPTVFGGESRWALHEAPASDDARGDVAHVLRAMHSSGSCLTMEACVRRETEQVRSICAVNANTCVGVMLVIPMAAGARQQARGAATAEARGAAAGALDDSGRSRRRHERWSAAPATARAVPWEMIARLGSIGAERAAALPSLGFARGSDSLRFARTPAKVERSLRIARTARAHAAAVLPQRCRPSVMQDPPAPGADRFVVRLLGALAEMMRGQENEELSGWYFEDEILRKVMATTLALSATAGVLVAETGAVAGGAAGGLVAAAGTRKRHMTL